LVPVAFSAAELEEAFQTLGLRARERGVCVEIAVYGGSSLVLASNFRVATRDVDAGVLAHPEVVSELTRQISVDRGWPDDWLNDGVSAYLSPRDDGKQLLHLLRSYPTEAEPGLRVFVPVPEYLLAMKLMAMRIDVASGQRDLDDIVNLLRIAGLPRKEDIIELCAGFYPEARVSGKLHLAIDALWKRYLERRNDEPAPEYPR
jgi:hypothetical protein